MRVIVNFIVFGLLFYALYLYTPNFFATLVSWAAAIFDFFHGIFNKLAETAKS